MSHGWVVTNAIYTRQVVTAINSGIIEALRIVKPWIEPIMGVIHALVIKVSM